MSKEKTFAERARELPLCVFVGEAFTAEAIPDFSGQTRRRMQKGVEDYCNEKRKPDFQVITVGDFLDNPLFRPPHLLRMPGFGEHSYRAFCCLLSRFDLWWTRPREPVVMMTSEAAQLLKDLKDTAE